jgi:tetratricopeptide (TPR) repeat protein
MIEEVRTDPDDKNRGSARLSVHDGAIESILRLSEEWLKSMNVTEGMDRTPRSLEVLDKYIDDVWDENDPKDIEVVDRLGAYVADVVQRNNSGTWMRTEIWYAFEFEPGFAVNPWLWPIFKLQTGVSIARAYHLTMEAAAVLQSGDRQKAGQLLSVIANEELRDDLHEGMVLSTQAHSAQERGDHQDARALLQRAQAFYEEAFGSEHDETMVCLSNLASAHKACGEHEQAEVLFRRVLAYHERVNGAEHLATALSLGNLGAALCEKGNVREATSLYRRALSIQEKVLGRDDLRIAETLMVLALALHSQGDARNESEKLLRRALEILEKTLPGHPDTACCLEMLADVVMQHTERAGEAEHLLRRALAIRENTRDPSALVECLNELATTVLISRLGREREVTALLRRALTIAELAMGRNHPQSQNIRGKLTALERLMSQGGSPVRRRA